MKNFRIAAVLAGILAAGTAFAQGTTQPKPSSAKSAPATKSTSTSAVHATQGVVKSIDANTLVITKSAGKGPETAFVVNSSTERQGNIATGVPVDVRYRDEGKTKVATAITMHQSKQPAAAKSKPAK